VTTLDAIILGIVQGITEFLPVSSSGHLHLFAYLLRIDRYGHNMLFDLTCHLGTLLATCTFFFRPIKEVFQQNRTRLYQLVLAILPLFPLLMIIKPIKAVYADPQYLGVFFLLTSAILFAGDFFAREKPAEMAVRHRWRDALMIGCCQAAAVFPGISRSGSTISGARVLGWNTNDALTFSFLLSIPTILGGVVLELSEGYRNSERIMQLPVEYYFIGFFISFIIGLCSLKFLLFIVSRYRFSCFAWYCLFLGIATTYYFYI